MKARKEQAGAEIFIGLTGNGRIEHGGRITHGYLAGHNMVALCGVKLAELTWGTVGRDGGVSCKRCQRKI